jgi:anti-anti-sigma regulatory factor
MVVRMAMIAAWRIDGDRMVHALEELRDKLGSADRELVLDFSSVRQIDPGAIRAMEDLAVMADEKAVKIVLRAVNIDVYKVLKLVRLAPRFSFVT